MIGVYYTSLFYAKRKYQKIPNSLEFMVSKFPFTFRGHISTQPPTSGPQRLYLFPILFQMKSIEFIPLLFRSFVRHSFATYVTCIIISSIVNSSVGAEERKQVYPLLSPAELYYDDFVWI